ncbi:MAG TPA: hypothetical protein VGJ74_20820 [Burkholderiales bacterium]|jgi:hypothetical protein
MTGGGLLELILLSMGWLFFAGGLAANYQVLRKSLRAKPDEQIPSSLGFVPGVVGSITVFFTIPALAKYGIDVPWPWLWILLPLLIDPYCLGGLVLLLVRK